MAVTGQTFSEFIKVIAKKCDVDEDCKRFSDERIDLLITLQCAWNKPINDICNDLNVDINDIVRALDSNSGFILSYDQINSSSFKDIIKFLYTFTDDPTVEKISEMTRVRENVVREVLEIDEPDENGVEDKNESSISDKNKNVKKHLSEISLSFMRGIAFRVKNGVNKKDIMRLYNISESLFVKIMERERVITESHQIIADYKNGYTENQLCVKYDAELNHIYWLLEKAEIPKHLRRLSVDTEQMLLDDYRNPDVSNDTLCPKYNISQKKFNTVIKKLDGNKGEE